MKILIYSTYKYDFVDNIIYSGLVQNLNKNDIFLYAQNNNALPKYADKKANIIYGKEILEELDNFDHIFFFNSAVFDDNFNIVLNKKNSATKTFFDGIDDFFIRNIYNHPEISHYFKRELYNSSIDIGQKFEWGIRYSYNLLKIAKEFNMYKKWFSYWNMPIGISEEKKFTDIKPFPLTTTLMYNNNRSEKKKTKYHVSFIGHYNNPERRRYIQFIRHSVRKYKLKSFISAEIIEKSKYFETIRDSRAGIALRGVGRDTWRYWEIPALGTALISQEVPIDIPNNFIDGESALFFKNNIELEEKIRKYIAKSDEWMEISRNGKRHFVKYHTPKERIKKLLEVIGG